jgi:hypothetical protein
MGVKLAVKKSTPVACESFGSLAAAIASPDHTESDSFSNEQFVQADAGQYSAVLYQGVGSGSAGFFVNFEAYNTDDPAAAFSIYTVTSGGSISSTVNSPDGVIEYGDDSLGIPSDAGDFYVVIYNSGGDSCDQFMFKLYDAT